MVAAFGAGPASHAHIASASACTVELVVNIDPKGHISQGGISGGFTTLIGQIQCVGTVSGAASVNAVGGFVDQGGGSATVEGDFVTGAGLLLHVDGPALPTVCDGHFSGSAIGLVAPLLTVSEVDCTNGGASGGTGAANIVFAPTPTGVEVGPPGCVTSEGDPDVCLTQVAAVGEVHWTDLS